MQINKYIFLYCLFTISIIACKTKVPQSNIETIKFEDNDDKVVLDHANEHNINKDTTTTTTTTTVIVDTVIVADTIVDFSGELKEEYNVAIILPFMEDSIRKSWEKAKSKGFQNFVFTKESEIATSFYEGFTLALEDVSLNSMYNIKVYDTENDLSKTRNIINKIKKEDSVDIIIGPYSKSNIIEVSKYTSSNDIIHISPFSPSKSASLGNAEYYMIEPSLEQHIISMLDYGIDSIEKPNFKFVYHNTMSGKSYANLVKNYIDELNKDKEIENQIQYTLIKEEEELNIDEYIDEESNNILIINSFNEDFIHVLLRQIASIDTSYNMTIFGMPGWESSEIVRLGYLNSAHVHFTSSTWIDSSNSNTFLFEEKYQLKYKTKASEYTYLGYDLASIFFKIIDKNGLSFDEKILGYEFKGISRNYIFKQVLSSDNKIHRIENTDLHIYKIDGFEKVLIK